MRRWGLCLLVSWGAWSGCSESPNFGGGGDGGMSSGGAGAEAGAGASGGAGAESSGGSGAGGSPNPDPDGDGFDTELEVACGTDPDDELDAPEPTLMLGQGTVEAPYRVCLADHLSLVGGDLFQAGEVFLLTYDIDVRAARYPLVPLPVSQDAFTGRFDGGGHRISGIGELHPDGALGALFKEIAPGGEVVALVLDEVAANQAPLAQTSYGLIDGVAVEGMAEEARSLLVQENRGTIRNATVLGTLVTSSDGPAGLLAARNFGTIEKSAATGEISGAGNVGGLVGHHNNIATLLREASFRGRATSTQTAGGLVGLANQTATIEDCYVLGEEDGITGAQAGGLVGLISTDAPIRRSYAATPVAGTSTEDAITPSGSLNATSASLYFDSDLAGSAHGTGLPTASFSSPSPFVGLDFRTIWTIGTRDPLRPVLAWE